MDTDETIEEKTLDEVIDEYVSHKKMYHFEGDTGVERLNTFTKDMGYDRHGFAYGSPLEAFLSDNPGAQEAIINWIRDQNIKDWKESLESCLPAEEVVENAAAAIADIKPDFAAMYGCREGEPGQRGWDPTKEGHG